MLWQLSQAPKATCDAALTVVAGLGVCSAWRRRLLAIEAQTGHPVLYWLIIVCHIQKVSLSLYLCISNCCGSNLLLILIAGLWIASFPLFAALQVEGQKCLQVERNWCLKHIHLAMHCECCQSGRAHFSFGLTVALNAILSQFDAGASFHLQCLIMFA